MKSFCSAYSLLKLDANRILTERNINFLETNLLQIFWQFYYFSAVLLFVTSVAVELMLEFGLLSFCRCK
jgi:hypothetical protein